MASNTKGVAIGGKVSESKVRHWLAILSDQQLQEAAGVVVRRLMQQTTGLAAGKRFLALVAEEAGRRNAEGEDLSMEALADLIDREVRR